MSNAESEGSTASIPCEYNINDKYFHTTTYAQYFRGMYDEKDAVFKFYSTKEAYQFDIAGCNHNVACSARILFKTDRFPVTETERLPCVIFDAQNALTVSEFISSKKYASLVSKKDKYTVAHALLKMIFSFLNHGRVHGHLSPDIILIHLSLETAQLIDFGGYTYEYTTNDIEYASLTSLRNDLSPEGDVFSIGSIVYLVWTGLSPYTHLHKSGAHAVALEIGNSEIPNAIHNPALTKTSKTVLRHLWSRASIRSALELLRKKAELDEFGFRNVASGPPPMRDFRVPQGTIGNMNQTLIQHSLNASAPTIDGIEDPFGYEGISAGNEHRKSFAVNFFRRKTQTTSLIKAQDTYPMPHNQQESPSRPPRPEQKKERKAFFERPKMDSTSKRPKSRTLSQIENLIIEALRASVDRVENINQICTSYQLSYDSKKLNVPSPNTKGKVIMVQRKISPGFILADLHDRILQGDTPLTAAAAEGDYDAVKFLVENNLFLTCRNAVGDTALMIAGAKGNPEIVSLLRIHESNFENKGMYALHYASAYNAPACVKLLLEFEKETIPKTGPWSPLQCAAYEGYLSCCQILVDHFAGYVSEDGLTALMIAADQGHHEIVKSLIRYESRIQQKGTGKSALMLAASAGHSKCVEYLLRSEARLVNWLEGGWTSLMYAAWDNRIDCCKLLARLERRMTNNEGSFALMCSAQNGHTECAAILAEHEAGLAISRSHGWTSMMEAANNGFLGVVKALAPEENGLCMEDGKCALMIAAKAGHYPVCEYLVDLEGGFQTYHGFTALLYAIRENRGNVAEYLYKNEAELQACENMAIDPIRYAVDLNRIEIATALSYIKEELGVCPPADLSPQSTESNEPVSRSRRATGGPIPVNLQQPIHIERENTPNSLVSSTCRSGNIDSLSDSVDGRTQSDNQKPNYRRPRYDSIYDQMKESPEIYIKNYLSQIDNNSSNDDTVPEVGQTEIEKFFSSE